MSFIIYIKLSFIENHPQHCSSIHLEMTLNWKVCFISVLCKWKIFRNDLFLKKLSGRQTIWHRMMTFCMKKQFFTNFLELFLNYFYVLYFLCYRRLSRSNGPAPKRYLYRINFWLRLTHISKRYENGLGT